MLEALKEAALLCKTIFRNGFDAHIINAPLQEKVLRHTDPKDYAIDLACETDPVVLTKIFPAAKLTPKQEYMATLEQNGVLYRFYPLPAHEGEHPEMSQMKVTKTILDAVIAIEAKGIYITAFRMPSNKSYAGFEPLATGCVQLLGIPDNTLRHNYLLAIRAVRFAANFDLPIEENSRLAIIRASSRVYDYVPAHDLLDEWRQVAPENMHTFFRLLFELKLLHGFIPELAALSSINHIRNKKTQEVEDLLTHTLECVRCYPSGDYNYDWYGTVAMLFHDIGKLYTAEYIDGDWTFYQHHRVGALVTRKILRRLRFDPEDIDMICDLVRNHMRFYAMMTDRGLRSFITLNEYPRLIAMAHADIEARNDVYTSYNHNLKYLERTATPEQLLEPLLNGNEIMKETKLKPGPMVGVLRDALLQAQVEGTVTNVDEAKQFVKDYVATH